MTTTMTRREQAEAYADLYEVPMTEMYRRYGAVLLRGREASRVMRAEVESGR